MFSRNCNVSGSNYQGTATGSFEITALNISNLVEFVLLETTPTYTGFEITPKYEVRWTVTGQQVTSYTESYDNNIDAGVNTAKYTVSFFGNFSGQATTTFTINPKSLTDVQIANIDPCEYTGQAVQPEPTVTDLISAIELEKDKDFYFEWSNNTAVTNSAVVYVHGTGNYTGSKSVMFSIITKQLTNDMIQTIPNQTYTGEEIRPTVHLFYNGNELVLERDYTVEYSNNTSIGTAWVTVNGIGNYSGSAQTKYGIVVYDLASVVIEPIEPQYYNKGQEIRPTLVVMQGNTELQLGVDYEVAYDQNRDAGTGLATISGIGNYSGTKSILFTILPKTITPSYIEGIVAKEYTGNDIIQDGYTVKDGETIYAIKIK